MARIKDLSQISSNFSGSSSRASNNYRDGVENPGASWKAATSAAEENWERGVNEAVAESRFARGVSRSSDEEWQRGAIEKGTQRIGPGIQRAREAHERGFAPYHAAISQLNLPKRGIKGSPENYEISRLVGTTLNERKKRLQAGSGS